MAVAIKSASLLSTLDQRSDRVLVRAAQTGKQDASQALVERYYPRVHSFISYLTDGTNVDDLTQEVFLRALAALSRFNGNYKFESWILRIARNLVIDEMRRQSNTAEPTDPDELFAMEPQIASDQVWESMAQKQAASMVRTALSKLPNRQRTSLVLREIDGMSYSAIAEVLGTNDRGVEATLRRARQRFRMEIAVAGDSDLQPACRKALLALAGGRVTHVAELHLKDCKRCGVQARSVRAADGLFGVLPPLSIPLLSDTTSISVTGSAASGRRGILESIREFPQSVFTGPAIQMIETAATFAIAGVLSVSTVVGQTGRVATFTTSLPVMQAPEVAPNAEPGADRVEAPQQLAVSVTDTPGTDTPGSEAPEVARPQQDHEVQPQLPNTVTATSVLGLDALGADLFSAADALTDTSELVLPELSLGGTSSDQTTEDPLSGLESLLPAAPGPVALPRRRIFS